MSMSPDPENVTGQRIPIVDARIIDTNPWVRRAGWAQFLDWEFIPELCQISGLPTADPNEAPLHEICNAFEGAVRMSQSITEKAGTAIRLTAAQEEPSQRPQRVLQSIDPALFKEFTEPWKRLLCLFARSEHTTFAGEDRSPLQCKYHFDLPQLNSWKIIWETALQLGKPMSHSKATFHRHGLALACLRFCVDLLCEKPDLYDTEWSSTLVCGISVLAMTPTGWQRPQEHCVMLKRIMHVARLMVVGRSCQLATDRDKLLQQWGLINIRNHLRHHDPGPKFGTYSGKHCFAEWVSIHVKHVMLFRDRSPKPLMPMSWIFSIYKFGLWLESIRLRPIEDGNDDRLAGRGDDYCELLKCGWEGGEGTKVEWL